LQAATELGAEGLQRGMDSPTKEACGLHVHAMKKFFKTLAVAAVALVLITAVALVAAYFTFCGSHPHGIC
jgi:hypothetical protein